MPVKAIVDEAHIWIMKLNMCFLKPDINLAIESFHKLYSVVKNPRGTEAPLCVHWPLGISRSSKFMVLYFEIEGQLLNYCC